MIKYWHYIKTTTPKDSLVYKFIDYAEQSETQKHCRWLSTVKFILKLCNLNYVWEDPTKIKHGALITKCFNHLVKRYCKFWHDCINNGVSCCPSKATITRCDLSPRFFCIDATLLCEFESDKI